MLRTNARIDIAAARRRVGQKRRAGWTLVEMLLAMAIGSAVIATSTTVAVQTVQTQKAVNAALSQTWADALIADSFSQDLELRLRGVPDEAKSVKLLNDPVRPIEVLCLAPAPSDGSLFPRMLPARVTYVIEDDELPENRRLVREVRFLTKPDEVHRYVLGRMLRGASVEALIEKSWQTSRPDSRQPQSFRAVRLVWLWSENERHVVTMPLEDAEQQKP